MKLITHPLSILFLMLSGFLLIVETLHWKAHHNYEADVHGHVKQFCRSNPEACQEILDRL